MRCKVVVSASEKEEEEAAVAEVAVAAATTSVVSNAVVENVAVAPVSGGDKPPARLCRVVKAVGQSYGFSIKMDKDTKMEVVDRVAIGGPAHTAGLVNGDHVWSVNGVRITGKSHDEVVTEIKRHPNHVIFTVTSGAVYKEYASDNSEPFEYLAVAEWAAEYGADGVPRNIRLEKEVGEKYGFTLEYKSAKHLAKSPQEQGSK